MNNLNPPIQIPAIEEGNASVTNRSAPDCSIEEEGNNRNFAGKIPARNNEEVSHGTTKEDTTINTNLTNTLQKEHLDVASKTSDNSEEVDLKPQTQIPPATEEQKSVPL